MTLDHSATSQACPRCGEPLTSEEIQSGAICTRCSAPASQRGLLPGEQWQDIGQSHSLGEIGSSRSETSPEHFDQGPEGTRSQSATATGGGNDPGHPPSSNVVPYYHPPLGGPGDARSGQSEWNSGSIPPNSGYNAQGWNQGYISQTGFDPNQSSGNGGGFGGSNQYWDAGWNAQRTLPSAEQVSYNPDRPPWGLLEAFGVWVFSFLSIVIFPVIAVVLWLFVQRAEGVPMQVPPDTCDPSIIFVAVLSTIVAHVFTLVVLWAAVTRLGKRPFWSTIGWKWPTVPPAAKYGLIAGALVLSFVAMDLLSSLSGPMKIEALVGFGVFAIVAYLAVFAFRPSMETWSKIGFVVGVVAVALIMDIILSAILPQSKGTDFEEMLKASGSVRLLISALAVFTAPWVEEGVYRGLLYSALRRLTSVGPAVAIVTVLFAGVHVPQYWGAWASIGSITSLSLLLTLVRARTKSILPCVAIHTLFNLINSAFILLHKY